MKKRKNPFPCHSWMLVDAEGWPLRFNDTRQDASFDTRAAARREKTSCERIVRVRITEAPKKRAKRNS